MIEVMGPDGPDLVFRSWSNQDVEEVTKHLPDLLQSGTVFAYQLAIFCREFCPTRVDLRRILAKKVKPTDLAKIHSVLPEPNHRLRHIEWNNGDNDEYKAAVTSLTDKCRTEF